MALRSFPAWLIASLLVGMAPGAFAKGQFQCSALSDKSKQTLDEMVQGKDGFFFRINRDLNENVSLTEESQDAFRRLAAALKARGTQLVMIPVPPRGAINSRAFDLDNQLEAKFSPERTIRNYTGVLKQLNDAGILTPDFFAKGHSVLELPADQPFNFRRDHHWTPFGARFTAEAVAAALKADPKYAKMAKSDYETVKKSDAVWKPKMATEISRLCESPIPAEPYPLYETTLKAKTGGSAADLFGDAGGTSPSVLLGSSFSAIPEFDFEGLLLQTTGIEIANWALSGGMQFNAIVSYMSSPNFVGDHPPYMLWELPYLLDIDNLSIPMMRQIIPAAYANCSGGSIVSAQKVKIAGGVADHALSYDPKQKIAGQGYYFLIETPNIGMTKFTLKMDYDDGDGEWFTVDRTDHFDKNGRFFIELNDEISSNLASVAFGGLGNVNADLSVKLCRAPKIPTPPSPPAT